MGSRQVAAAALLCLALSTPTVLAQEQAGDPAEVDGDLEVLIVEDFDHGHAEHAYFVHERGSERAFELKFHQPPGRLHSGQRVHVKGHAQGRKMAVDTLSLDGSTSSPAAGKPAAVTPLNERRAVVLMVDLLDAKASTRYTLAQISSNMYTGAQSVDGLYREASYNQVSFRADSDGNSAPDVFGPFAIPYSAANCDYYSWASAAESAAQAAGIDLSRYQHRVFVLPRYNDLPNCGWAGIANVGCSYTYCRAWIAEGESPVVYAHELGHNLGMAHAGTDPENDGILNNAYGDLSDPMGLSRSWHVFNAPHADQMGWYNAYPGSIVTVTTSGTYTVAALGTTAYASAPQMLKVQKPNTNEFYYVSYRQPIGYDAGMAATYTQGINIHRYTGSGYDYTYFIKSLTDMASFTDNVNGTTITQVSHDATYATVTIVMPCVMAAPTVSLSPASQVVRSGSTLSYPVSVSNMDGSSCRQTTFTLSYTGSPAGSLSPPSLTLAGGQSGAATLQLNTALTDGTYTLQVQASDNDGIEPTHTSPSSGTATVTIDGTPPTVPANLTATLGTANAVRLGWNAASDTGSGVARYTVRRNGVALGDTTTTSYTDSSAQPSVTYSYTVTAADAVGNLSGASNPVSISLPSNGGGGGSTDHIGDLDRSASKVNTKNWSAQVSVLVENASHAPVAGAVVTGKWSGGYAGTMSCTTGTTGRCTIATGNISTSKTSATFTVSSVTASGLNYTSSANHDPDGDSNGTQITVSKP